MIKSSIPHLTKSIAIYESILRYLFLLGAALFPFSNTIGAMLPIIGILVIFSPGFYYQGLRGFKSYTWLITALFITVVLIHMALSSPYSHSVKQDFGHFLYVIPIFFIGYVFSQTHQKIQAHHALHIGATMIALLQIIYVLAIHYPHTYAFSLTKNVLWINNLINHATFSHLQGRAVFLAIGFYLSVLRLIPARNKKTILKYSALSMVFIVAIFTQQERVGYLCFFMAGIYLGFIYFRWKGIIYGLLICLFTATVAYQLAPSGYGIKVKLAELWQSPIQKNRNESTQLRLDGIKNALVNIKYKPMGFGIGEFHGSKNNGDYVIVKHPGSIETFYLALLLQLGIIGGFLYLSLLGNYAYIIQREKIKRKDSDIKDDSCGGNEKNQSSKQAIGILILLCTGALTFPLFLTTTGLSILIVGIGTQLWNESH